MQTNESFRPRRALLCLAVAALLALPSASPNGQVAGIRAVTADDVAAAVAWGKGDGSIGWVPLFMRLASLREPDPTTTYPGPRDAESMESFLRACPFGFSIDTPYTRIASRARSVTQDGAPMPLMTAEEANRELVRIFVGPWPRLATADSVKTVILRREAREWNPVRQSFGETKITEGSHEGRFASGTFTFPFEPFEPLSDITVVIVGTKRRVEWIMTRDELAAMR